jgi:threonine dehydrogenase-like Zn-dependent dehydrogenase
VHLPATGRAAVVTAYEEPVAVREYPVTPPPPGAILVRIDRATICGTDIHAWQGLMSKVYDIELPIILGHEMVGRIVAFGDGPHVDSAGTPLAEGDRVVWDHEACGHCYYCTVERMGTLCVDRRIGFLVNADREPHFHGGFAEYSYVWPKSGRLRVPDEVQSDWASASSCALRTVINAWDQLGVVDYRHTVVIQGAGPLGLFATAVAAAQGPKRLVVIGGPAARLEIAKAWGADAVISVDEHPDPLERRALVLEETDGRGGDVVGEFSGGRGAVAEGIGLAALNGRYAVVGTVGGGEQVVPAHEIVHKNLTIKGTLSAEIDAYYKALEFLRTYRDRFDWDLMMGTTYGLDDLTTGLERMRSFDEVKAVVAPELDA